MSDEVTRGGWGVSIKSAFYEVPAGTWMQEASMLGFGKANAIGVHHSISGKEPIMKSFIPLLGTFALVILAWSQSGAQQSKPGAAAPLHIPANAKGGWKIRAAETQGTHSILESVVPPGIGPEPHRHSREDEGFYVMEGQYEFRVGDQVIPATAGAYLFAPRDIPHTYRNVGSTPSRHLTIISPAGLEKFFEERTALIKEVPTTDPAYPAR